LLTNRFYLVVVSSTGILFEENHLTDVKKMTKKKDKPILEIFPNQKKIRKYTA